MMQRKYVRNNIKTNIIEAVNLLFAKTKTRSRSPIWYSSEIRHQLKIIKTFHCKPHT